MNFNLLEKVAISLGVLVIGVIIVISITVNPALNTLAPKCFLFQTTGIQCPLCGGQRSVYAFFQGDWLASWNFNHLPITVGTLLIMYLINKYVTKWRAPKILSDNKWYILAVYLIGFFILRNIF